MFEIVVSCSGLSEATGRVADTDIANEFVERPWHIDVRCWWEGDLLLLCARNDYDTNGQALADEFSDAVCACTPIEGEIGIHVVTVRQITEGDA